MTPRSRSEIARRDDLSDGLTPTAEYLFAYQIAVEYGQKSLGHPPDATDPGRRLIHRRVFLRLVTAQDTYIMLNFFAHPTTSTKMSQSTILRKDDDDELAVDNANPQSESEKWLPTDEVPRLERQAQESHVRFIPWRYKLLAGSMILLFAFGSSLSETTLGPLKSTLIKELEITSQCRFERTISRGVSHYQTLSMVQSPAHPAL